MAKPTSNPGKGNGPNKPTGTLTLVMVDDQNGDGLPNHGDSILFTVVTDEAWYDIAVTCSQNGQDVMVAEILASNPQPVLLSATGDPDTGGPWASGAADGVAVLRSLAKPDGSQMTELGRLEFAIGA